MKEPTAELRGSTLGDAFGICWFLRDVDGVRTVGHGGSANGQFAELLTVPERGFAVVALANATDGVVMTLAADIKPQIRAAADEELPPGYPREEIGLLPGDGDEYVITSGGMKGMRGFFTRDESGAVVGIDAGGRMYRRVPAASE